jgi:hypothetical protein
MGIDIPFTMNGGKKDKSFRLFNNEQLDMNYKLNNISFLSIIDKITGVKQNSDAYLKASDTKKYYEDIKTKNKQEKINKEKKIKKKNKEKK